MLSKSTMLKVVCVFVLQGLLARAFPTVSDVDGILDGSSGPVLVEGVTEFRGFVPASGSVTVMGNFGSSPFFSAKPPIVGNAAPFIQRNEYLTPVNRASPWFSRNVNNMYNADPEMYPVLELAKEEYQYVDDHINYMDDLSKKVLFGSLIADSIIGGKEAEIEAKLAEIDSIVNYELSKANSILDTVLENAIIEEINSLLNSDLSDIESEIDIMDRIMESELEKVDQVLEFILEDKNTMMELEQAVMELLTELRIVPSATEISQVDMNKVLAEIHKIVESELAVIDSFIQLELAKVDLFIEAELAKMESLVEAKEALIQALIHSELNNMNTFMDSELDKIGASIDFEPFLYPDPAMVERPMQGLAQFSGIVPATGKVSLFGSTGCSPMFDSFDVVPDPQLDYGSERLATAYYNNIEDKPEAVVMGETSFSGIVPAVGRVKISGAFGCPPPFPSNPPIVRNAGPCIKNDGVSLADRITSSLLAREQYNAHNNYHTGFPFSPNLPVVGKAGPYTQNDDFHLADRITSTLLEGEQFNAHNNYHAGFPLSPTNPPVVGKAATFTQNDDFHVADRITSALLAREQHNARNNYPPALSQVNYLPPVNLNHKNRMNAFEESTADTVEFNGRTRATGRTTVFASFGCAPLLPTQEGPDGKKYIWLLNKPNNSVVPPPPSKLQHRPNPTNTNAHHAHHPPMPMYPTDFSDTISMDATKNYEKFIDDPARYQDSPIIGNMFFEGVVPAFGSVSLTGHCA